MIFPLAAGARTSRVELQRGRRPATGEAQPLAVFCTSSPANRHLQNSPKKYSIKSTGNYNAKPLALTCIYGPLLVGQHMFREVFFFCSSKDREFASTLLYLPTALCSRAGNYEGFTHANSSYNDNVLKRLYKRIHYMGGCVDCAPWRTLKSPDGKLYVEMVQKKPKHC